MKRQSRISTVLLLSATLAFAGAARAQFPFSPGGDLTVRDPDTAIKFNLFPPGARSLAMGGAFLGLADDATAAYTNPAGLTNLALGGSEVALELRQTRFTSSFADQGHYNTTPGFPTFVRSIGQDFVNGLPRSEADSDTSGLSFLSFGYVLKGGLTVALYRHELANFRSGFDSQGPFNDDLCTRRSDGALTFDPDDADDLEECQLFRVFPRRSSIDLEIVNTGLSAAYGFDLPTIKGLESTLSLGLGVSFYQMELDGLRETFDLCRFDGPRNPDGTCVENRLPGGFFGAADFSPDNSQFSVTETGNDQAFGFSFGFLWKLGRQQRWSVGGVFRQGPDFETEQELAFRSLGGGARFEVEAGQVTVPNLFGVGLAFRTGNGNTKVTLDVNRVRYSQTLGDFTAGIGEVDDPSLADYQIPNVTQVHLGLERIVLVVESVFVGTVRFGAWHEPFHEPVYVGGNRDLQAIQGRPTDDEIHLSGGLGLVIKEDYQIDVAVDVSDPTSTFSVSLVTFF